MQRGDWQRRSLRSFLIALIHPPPVFDSEYLGPGSERLERIPANSTVYEDVYCLLRPNPGGSSQRKAVQQEVITSRPAYRRSEPAIGSRILGH